MTAFTTLPFCTWPSGADSFTAAVIMSPSPAFNPVEPPSGRIICSLRAPELSATSSIDLIITAIKVSPYALTLGENARLTDVRHRRFRQQSRLPAYFFKAPALEFRQRTGLFEAHDIAHVGHIFFVVSVELLGLRDHPFVEGMSLFANHLHHDGLVHAARYHFADYNLAPSRCLRLRCGLWVAFSHTTFSPCRCWRPVHVRGRWF